MKLTVFILFFTLTCIAGRSQDKIIDMHVHLWNGDTSVVAYQKELDSTKQNITGFSGILIASKGETARTRFKNDELIAFSKKYANLLPICSVHPLDGDSAVSELQRVAKLGVKIIKLHPHTQRFDVTDPRVYELCQEAGRLGVTILMDNASIKPGDCENLFDLAVKCADTRFIFAHLGALNFRFWNIIPVARTAKGFFKDNIYFDISATVVLLSGSPIEREFIWTLRNVGIDHLMLGSDYPQYSLQQAAKALEGLDLTKAEKKAIRFDNAARLFFPQLTRAGD